jgi:putative ABC transport system substrate-binding protein
MNIRQYGVLVAGLLLAGIVHAGTVDAWFKLFDENRADWTMQANERDPLRVDLRPTKGAGRPAHKVLVLYPKASAAYDVAMNKLLAVFGQKRIAASFVAVNYLNDAALGHQAVKLARREKADLIFAMGSESTAFLFAAYRQGSIPVVSVCAKDPVHLGQMPGYDVGSGTHFAFTSLNMSIDSHLAYLLRLRPQLRNVGILVDARNLSSVQTQAEPLAAALRTRNINAVSVAVADPAKAAAELAQRIPLALAEMRRTDPALANSVFLVTGSTAVFGEIATINQYAGQVPVLSMVPEVVRAGDDTAVLSVGISFESNAHLAAIYGVDVLSGKVRPGDLKVGVVSPPDIAISFRKARAIGLKIPFAFFEAATYIYDYEGRPVRDNGIMLQPVPTPNKR